MKLDQEKIESVVAALEAEALSTGKNVCVEFHHKPAKWELGEKDEDGAWYTRDTGFSVCVYGRETRLEERGGDAEVGETIYTNLYELKHQDGEITEEGFFWDDLEQNLKDALKQDYNKILYEPAKGKKQEFNSWAEFAKAVGLSKLEVLATKVAKAVNLNFQAMCRHQGETPSERLRKLVQDEVETYLRNEAKRLMFKDQEAA